MRKLWIILAIMALALGGCGAETELAVTPTATFFPSPEPTVTMTAAVVTPTPVVPEEFQLDAQTTFEVIAAVHAYVLMVEDWAGADLSLFERQAMVYPLLEVGLSPLGEVFGAALPDPELADVWLLSEGVYTDFAPLALDWAGGKLSPAEFLDGFAEIKDHSRQMIESAAVTASSLGVETARYGPGYVDAAAAVFGLLPGPEAGEGVPAAVDVRLEQNDDLLAVEVQPFLYPFAGSEVFLVVGQVENTGSAPLADVEIEVSFYNFLDEHLGTVRGRLMAGTANPGEVYPFSASTVTEGEEAALKDWIRYEVVGYARPADAPSYQAFDLTITETSQDASGEYLLKGELTNSGDQSVSAEAIRVGVMAFDGAGQLVGVGDGYVIWGVMVLPGATVPFQANVEAVNGEPVEFRFFAEAVPEN